MKTQEFLKAKFGKDYDFIIEQLKNIITDRYYIGFMIYGKFATGKTTFCKWFDKFIHTNQTNMMKIQTQDEILLNCVIVTQNKQWFDNRPKNIHGFVFTKKSPNIELSELLDELPDFSAMLKSTIKQ